MKKIYDKQSEVNCIAEETHKNILNVTNSIQTFDFFLNEMPELFVTKDRYGGVYSYGYYTAWLCKPVYVYSAFGDDGECATFWIEARTNSDFLVGKGHNPHEALFDLYCLVKLYLKKSSPKRKIIGKYAFDKQCMLAYDKKRMLDPYSIPDKIYPITIIGLKPSLNRLWIGLYDEPNELYPKKVSLNEDIDRFGVHLLTNEEDCLQYYPSSSFIIGETPHEIINRISENFLTDM